MTRFRFDHVGLLTADVDYAWSAYRALGCELTERSYRRDTHDVAYGGAGTDVLIEIQGRPLPPESEEYLTRQGWSIERVALRCDDVEHAYQELIAAGLKSAWKPEPFIIDGTTLAIAAGVWSPEGLMIDIVEHRNVAVPRPQRHNRDKLALHHLSCLTDDLAQAEAFWTQHFGLIKTYDFTAPLELDNAKPASSTTDYCTTSRESVQGFVMLADPFFDTDEHEFCLEIIGGAFDTIDGPVFEQRGPCFDHLCFTTDDVSRVWQRAVDAGVAPLSKPAYYPEYDTTIAWLYDADGTHIELMNPPPPELMLDAHRGSHCSNHWVDDWRRNPEVFTHQPNQSDNPIQLRRQAPRPT